METVQEYVKPVREFAKDSMRLVKRCTKPDLKGMFSWRKGTLLNRSSREQRKINCIAFYFVTVFFDLVHQHNLIYFTFLLLILIEFQKIALATAVGFAIMGFIGFFVKLIHIPINNIIV